MPEPSLTRDDLIEVWPVLTARERVEAFTELSRVDAEELFLSLTAREQADLMRDLPAAEQRLWMRALAPDDAADVIQEAEHEERGPLLNLLDGPTRREVIALLAYEEDEAGGLMNPRYARLRPEMTVDEAMTYLRRQTDRQVESIYYAYVLEADQQLLGVISLRQLFRAKRDEIVREIMETDLVTLHEHDDQEAAMHTIAEYDLLAVPVVDDDGHMKGVVTVDDVVDVAQEEATEDIHKIGGTEALTAPYLQVRLREMLLKRIGWLSLLLLMSFITVQAMKAYQGVIASMTILAAFVPMIISSGGNSGSQATTLVIRAIALDEIDGSDWWRVIRRELLVGLSLGSVMAVLALVVIGVWHLVWPESLGDAYLWLALTVACSIIGVVTWGTTVGSMLPFVLRLARLDPASASAPLVATLLDATGVLIYFTVARTLLSALGVESS